MGDKFLGAPPCGGPRTQNPASLTFGRVALLVAIVLGSAASNAQTLTGARASAFEYNPSTGLISAEIVEPDAARADFCVRTAYTRDQYGNQSAGSVSACTGASASAQFVTRTTTSVYLGQSVSIAGVGTVSVPAGAYPTQVTNALGHVETRQFDPRFGAPISVTGPNALTTQTQFDDLGRKVLEVAADGNRTITRHCFLPAAVDDVSSNSAGCVSSPAGAPSLAVSYVESQPANSAGTPNGPYVRKYADSLGRVIREETQGFDGVLQPSTARTIIKDTEYNAYGAVVRVSQPYFLESGSSVTSGGAPGWTSTQYDAHGRPTFIYTQDDEGNSSPPGDPQIHSVVTFSYNGLSVVETPTRTSKNTQGQQQAADALTSTRLKNPIGQLVEVKDHTGATVTYRYDAFGSLLETRDPQDNRILTTYDIRGRKTSMSDPNAGTWNYRYNALGEMTGQQSPLQIVGTPTIPVDSWTTLAYDLLGRLTQRVEPEYTTTWSYDQYADGAVCAKGIGKLCQVSTSHGVSTRTAYDPYGRPSSLTQAVASGPSFTTSRTFDANGRLATYTYPTGLSVAYQYTPLGFQQQITQAGVMVWQAEKANAWGRLEQFQLGGSSQTTTRTYNPQTGRIKSIQAGADGSILSQSYGWDTVGNLTDRIEVYNTAGAQSISEVFGYDDVNRLKSYEVSSPGIAGLSRNVVLVYGPTGNILYKSDLGTYNYPDAGPTGVRPGAVSSIAAATGPNPTYAYDVAGNLTTATNGKYSQIQYTSFNLPDGSSGVLGANNTRYTWQYGPNHERVKEVKAGVGPTRTTWYHHPDNQNGLGFEQEVVGASTIKNRHYVSAGGQAFLVLTTDGDHTQAAAQTVTAQQWWHRDQLGSVATITDATYAVALRFSYDPFGKRRTIDGSYDAAGALAYDHPGATDRGFTGHEHLDDVGIVHMNGRMYDPLLGRFMQADPLIQDNALVQNFNRYSYVLNNPLNATDPTGKWWQIVALSMIATARATGVIDTRTARQLAGLVATIWIAGLDPSNFGALAGSKTITFTQAVIAGTAGGAVACGIECAATGGASAMTFHAAGTWAELKGLGEQSFGKALAHGVGGCVTNVTAGGKCGHGAAAAFVNQSVMSRMSTTGEFGLDVARNAVVGGTVSAIGGGKFANGAALAAFQHLFNCLAHQSCAGRLPVDGDGYLETRYANGQAYIVRLSGLCATPECIATGANVDWADPRSQAYAKAIGAELLTLTSDVAAIVVIKTPLSTVGKAAGNVGLAADATKAAVEGRVDGLAPNVIETALKPWLNRVWGFAESTATRISTGVGKLLDKNPPANQRNGP